MFPRKALVFQLVVIPVLLKAQAGKGILKNFSGVGRKQDDILEFFHSLLLQTDRSNVWI